MKKSELRQIIREEIKNSNKTSSIGEKFWGFELEISDEETAEEEKETILGLNSYEEALNYYLEERGWDGDAVLMGTLLYFLVTILDNQ